MRTMKGRGRACFGAVGTKCGRQRTCGSVFLELWQIKGMLEKTLEVWQGKEFGNSGPSAQLGTNE